MAFKDVVVEGTLVARASPFSSLKGFAEREDKNFQENGLNLVDSGTGASLLYDVRSLYGFFLWLDNLTAEDIDFTLFYTFKNFTDIKNLTGDTDWQPALDSNDNPIAGTILAGTNQEIVEFVRATARVSGLRIDFDPPQTEVIINGVFSAV